MTSRMVTVDLILEVSLRLTQYKLAPITKEDFELYDCVKGILNGWAKQIEDQGLLVSLETIAENAVAVYYHSKGELSWQRLMGIGDQLIDRAREIDELILNRWSELVRIPREKEIVQALKEGKDVEFKDAAHELIGLKNVTDERERLREFVELVRYCDTHPGSEAWHLLNGVVVGQKLTTGFVELLKEYLPRLKVLRDAEKRKKKQICAFFRLTLHLGLDSPKHHKNLTETSNVRF